MSKNIKTIVSFPWFILVPKNDKQRTATINRVGMAQGLQNIYSKENVAKEKVPIKDTNNGTKSNKCSQCNYAYSHPSELIKHLKICMKIDWCHCSLETLLNILAFWAKRTSIQCIAMTSDTGHICNSCNVYSLPALWAQTYKTRSLPDFVSYPECCLLCGGILVELEQMRQLFVSFGSSAPPLLWPTVTPLLLPPPSPL